MPNQTVTALHNNKIVVTIYLAAATLEGIISAGYLLFLPADAKNSALLGYSFVRLLLLALIILLVSIFVYMLINSVRKPQSLQPWFNRTTRDPFTLWGIFFSSLVIGWEGVSFLNQKALVNNQYLSLFMRIEPLIYWLVALSLQTAFLIGFFYFQEIGEFFNKGPLQKVFPPLHHRTATLSACVVFLIIITGYLPALISQAYTDDAKFHHKVSTIGDDIDYQNSAVNLLYGYGFAGGFSLPLETYQLDLTTTAGNEWQAQYQQTGITTPTYTFYRSPGLPLLLSLAYRFFGVKAIVFRLLMASLFWGMLIVLLGMGAILGGWLGTVAGGLAAVHLFCYSPLFDFGQLRTELPAAFFICLFCLLFLIYLQSRKYWTLILSALSLVCVIFIRFNFFATLPFLAFYLWIYKHRWKNIALFLLVVLLPFAGWSIYASSKMGKLVIFTTQGESDFPTFNNIDVLEGVAPNPSMTQGTWNPGFVVDEQGNWTVPTPYRNTAKPGENGYIKGVTFWVEHLDQMPRFFYIKLWSNFWYDGYDKRQVDHPVGINLIAIGFLLFSLGLRNHKIQQDKLPFTVIMFQFSLLLIILLFWNELPFWVTLLLWLTILAVALAKPYGNLFQLPYQTPDWFLAFLLGHLVVTLLYGSPRFHQPLDPPLILFGILGGTTLLYELAKHQKTREMLFSLLLMIKFFRYP